MPFATFTEPNSSLASFHYTISTPSNTSSNVIDRGIPTVVFLHPVLAGSVIFHPQFADRHLRRFNLVAIEGRSHGLTQARPSIGYGPKEAAEDVYKVMKYLELPACHFIGVSTGSSIALELAVSHPENVLSVVMLSPLPFTEPVEILEGRTEMIDYWEEAMVTDSDEPDIEALASASLGALQLMFNNEASSHIDALERYCLAFHLQHFNREKLRDVRTVAVDFFLQPRSRTRADLSRIKATCPFKLVYFSDDIAYLIENSKETLRALRDANVEVSLGVLPGPHYGLFTRPEILNPVLHEFLLSVLDDEIPLPPIPMTIMSPFEETLKTLGWDPEPEEDCDVFPSLPFEPRKFEHLIAK